MQIGDTTHYAQLRHLTTEDDMRSLEREMTAVKANTARLVTKADVYLLIGIAYPVAVAVISIAIKSIFFGGS